MKVYVVGGAVRDELLGRGYLRAVRLEILQGALQVKKKFDDAVSVFILPPSMTVLRQRLLARAPAVRSAATRR